MLTVTDFITRLLEGSRADKPVIQGTWRGRPAWSGVADAADGVILQAVSYRTAESWDFHHSIYLKEQYVDMLEEGRAVFWYVNEDGAVDTEWCANADIPLNSEITTMVEREVTKQIFRSPV